MTNPKFYTGTKLLSMRDINGNRPEIFMACSNRTAGKTTYFNRLVVNRHLSKKTRKFGLIYRYKTDLDASVGDRFFKDIQSLFFQNYSMTAEKRAGGAYYELFMSRIGDDEEHKNSCGYAIALSANEKIKRESHLLSDIDEIIFDEFQSENNSYLPNEVNKFMSIHDSIARGGGQQVRYVPCYLIGNKVSQINPYFVAMNISTRLKGDTKFLRGEGFVLELNHNESAKQALSSSAFHQAFAGNDYSKYATEGVYLNDNEAFIEKPDGQSTYIATLRYMKKDFALREYPQHGIIYCDDKADSTFPTRISVTTEDHRINYVMLKRNNFFLMQMRFLFEKGSFRFKDLQCKDAVLKALSY